MQYTKLSDVNEFKKLIAFQPNSYGPTPQV